MPTERYPRCCRCRYILHGLKQEASRCPECGWVIEWDMAWLGIRPILSVRIATCLLTLVIALIPVRVFTLSGGFAWAVIVRPHTFDHVFRYYWNVLSAMHIVELLAAMYLVWAVRCTYYTARRLAVVSATLAICICLGGVVGRYVLHPRPGGTMMLVDLAIAIGSCVVYACLRYDMVRASHRSV